MKEKKINILPIILAAAAAAALIVALILSLGGKKAEETGGDTTEPVETAAPRTHVAPSELRGAYVPTVYNLTFPSKADLGAEELKDELDAIVDDSISLGLNTVIFQVRPQCDALYKSDIYPVSTYLSTSGELPLDCLDYLVKTAHEKNVSVMAWVNPYRVSVGKATVDGLQDGSPARGKYADFVVSYAGKLYFDPAHPEVRDLVCDGIAEIVENYEVDAVIFDDYFYPYLEYETDGDGNRVLAVFDDAETFAKYGEEGVPLDDFRRANVNELVRRVHETVRSIDPECRFGVACFGIWRNDDGENGGSFTSGLESYSEIYCDPLAWINAGSVDFLAPQIYWETSSLTASFKVLSTWWNERVRGKDVTLYFSHAAYRYEGDDFAPGELTKQLDFARSLDSYSGSAFYSFAAFRDDLNGIREEIGGYYRKGTDQ